VSIERHVKCCGAAGKLFGGGLGWLQLAFRVDIGATVKNQTEDVKVAISLLRLRKGAR
jgi:hypothetical protein